ncbi:MAG TPA: GNAT family N-acetyltransferase [Actinopolymorphaceae bacterium]|jgi:predicted acetyltransferase
MSGIDDAEPLLEVRELTDDEIPAAVELVARGFNADPESEESQLERPLWSLMTSHGAFLGGELVGHTGGFDFPMTVPGASARVLGVTNVGVSALARRRGVATELMRAQLHAAHLEGYVAAALWATEPRIYGRFGYGNAVDMARLTVVRSRSWLREIPGIDEVTLHRVALGDAPSLVRQVQNADATGRPGLFPWDDAWTARQLDDTPGLRESASPLQVVRAERGGRITGYAIWNNKGDWSPGYPDGTVQVRDVRAFDPATHAAIWRMLLDYDLMGRTRVSVPVDDVLLSLLEERRSAKLTISDALHVRLLDVAGALSARRYRSEVDVIIEVRDSLLPWNAGLWHLTGNRTGAKCVPTGVASGEAAGFALDIRDLAAVYLGGGSLLALQRAGLVVELVPGAVASASRAFSWDVAPYSDMVF